MKCPECSNNLILECDFEDEEIKWESYNCSKCNVDVIKYYELDKGENEK